MPDRTLVDLSRYRLNKAGAMLETARRDLAAGDYASANNRAYYCVFHAMRAALALDGEDYKKHSAVISRFSQLYLKTELLPKSLSKIISNASLIRTRSDYEDFYICSYADTERLVAETADFLNQINYFLQKRYEDHMQAL